MLFDDDLPFDLSDETDRPYPSAGLGADDLEEMWVAHERPDRPLAYGAWLCDCGACYRSLEAAVAASPRLPIVLKTSADRIVVSASRAQREWQERGTLEGLLLLSYDYIREVFVGDAPPPRWDGEFGSLHQSLSQRGRRPRRATRAGR
jgi:hypothetical protein